ncbi:hypothetical protein ACT6QG_11745 [Xanthobacter sp. TB0136]
MTRKLWVTGALVAIMGVAVFFAPQEAEATDNAPVIFSSIF